MSDNPCSDSNIERTNNNNENKRKLDEDNSFNKRPFKRHKNNNYPSVANAVNTKNNKNIWNGSRQCQSDTIAKKQSNLCHKIETKIWKIDSNKKLTFDDYLKNALIVQAGKALSKGELIGFPTETVYGLGANAFSNKACNKIFIAKGRPNDNPLIVHISEIDQLYKWILKPINTNSNTNNNNNNTFAINPIINKLIESFWPGPLSIVFPYVCDNKQSDDDNTNIICSKVRGAGKLHSVAIRMPSNNIARALISLSGCPIAAPSANISGRPSPTNGKHVINDMYGKIYGILDCGEVCCDVGLESTVIKLDEINHRIIILRPGGITKNMMLNVIKDEYNIDIKYSNEIKQDKENEMKDMHVQIEAPGMKYRHYAPKKPLYLVEDMDLFVDIYAYYKLKNEIENIVFIITRQNQLSQKCKENKNVLFIGNGDDLNEIAQNLFVVLRKIDDNKEYKNIKLIFCQVFDTTNIGVAIMNRLNKASQSNKIIKNINDLELILQIF